MGIRNFRIFLSEFFKRECITSLDVSGYKAFTENTVADSIGSSHGSTSCSSQYLGVYVDMPSLLYFIIVRFVKNSEEYAKYFDGSEQFLGKDEEELVCDLTDNQIKQLAFECTDVLFAMMTPGMFLKLRRLFLSYDTYTPVAKRYEQKTRQTRQTLIISRNVRERIWLTTIEMTRRRLFNHYYYSNRKHDTVCGRLMCASISTTVSCEKDRINAANDIISDVMVLSRNPKFDNVVTRHDSPFPVGEGEWKCFQQIWDDRYILDHAYIYGNDWDIGLGILLYQNGETVPRLHYISRAYSSRSDDVEREIGECSGPSSSARKLFNIFTLPNERVHRSFDHKGPVFFALCVIGNDYVPRLLYETQDTFAAMSIITERMFNNTADLSKCFEEFIDCGTDSHLTRERMVESLTLYLTMYLKGVVDVKKIIKTVIARPKFNGTAAADDSRIFYDEYFDRIKTLLRWTNGNYKYSPFTDISLCDKQPNRVNKFLDSTVKIKMEHKTNADSSSSSPNKTTAVVREQISLRDILTTFADISLWYLNYCVYHKSTSGDALQAALKRILIDRPCENPVCRGESAEGCGCIGSGNLPDSFDFIMPGGGLPTRNYRYNDGRSCNQYTLYNVGDMRRKLDTTEFEVVYQSIFECVNRLTLKNNSNN